MIFSLVSKRTMGTSQPMIINAKTDYIMTPKPKPAIVRAAPQVVSKNVDIKPTVRTMKWGEPVWFFLHTVAHKVKDEHFAKLRTELLKHVYTICVNLPCPDCSNHAKIYLNGINFNNIKTKYDLKNMLFEFHNSVNRRKGFAEFPKDELDRKYDSANFNAVVNYFIKVFLDKHASPRMISDDMYRARLTQTTKQWIIENLNHFTP